MISARNVTLAYGKRVLFDEVNLSFTKGKLLWHYWRQWRRANLLFLRY
jgi:hypothetical protein